MVREVRESSITHVTVTGKVIPSDKDSYMELVLLAYRFRKSLVKAVKMYAKGIGRNTIVKEVTKELNLGYADTIYKLAKLIVEGARHNNSNLLKIKIRKMLVEDSLRTKYNIRLLSTSKLQVNIPWKGWIRFRIEFGEQYIPLVNELTKKALSKELSYTSKIVVIDGKIYLHISVPIVLYLKYFRKRYIQGNLIAGFDLNSDRINMVIVDKQGIIRDVKTEWYSEVTSHGFPRNKVNAII